jgi:hypothetical protein
VLTEHLETSMKGTVMEKCIGQILQASNVLFHRPPVSPHPLQGLC